MVKKEENQDIEIINGKGENLNISPVYDHIKINKPTKPKDKNKKIVVPKSERKEKQEF